MTTTIPVAEDLFRGTGDGPALVGSRCTGCGSHYFPRSLSCRNPACDDKAVEDVLMGRQGRLYTWTVQHYQPPVPFRMDERAPYTLGLVELPEGLRVLGILTGCPVEELRVDMPLRLVTVPLFADTAVTTLTYAYAPSIGVEA